MANKPQEPQQGDIDTSPQQQGGPSGVDSQQEQGDGSDPSKKKKPIFRDWASI